MTLRTQFILYLAALHCLLVAASGFALWRVHPAWILLVEAVCGASFWIAFVLFRRFYEPLRLLKSSADFLKDTDFSTTLLPTGQPETDALVSVYNTMLTTLRTERVRVEEKGILLQTLINASPTGILLCDESLTVLSVNPALEAMFAMSAEASIGSRLSRHLVPFAELVQHLGIGASEVFTHKARRFKVHKAGFVEKGVPHIIVLVEELTDELRASEKTAYQRIIRVLAHEVNNSTGAARSLMESALHYERHFVPEMPDDERKDFRDALTIASERLAGLGEFMREYAHVVRLPTPKPQAFDIGELLVTTATLFGEVCKAHHITLRVISPNEAMMIRADKVQLQQALTNLTKNAIEAVQCLVDTAQDRSVTLSVRRRDSASVSIAVEDTGSGLNASAAANILTPFFTTKETGQGIGLMLVREIAAAHGFAFSLENRVGGGARAEMVVLSPM
jgi:nitrogen fixation/metabolism regulation signal transduction histidine kinase